MTVLVRIGYNLTTVCEFVGISRQAYYKRIKIQFTKEKLYQSLEQIVINNRKEKSRAGLRSIFHKEGLSSSLGINQFEKQMSSRGYSLKPYKSYIKTTDSRGNHNVFDNLIEGTEINNENQIIVGDITYYQNNQTRYYIFHFRDYYTLEMKGLIGSKTMEGIYAEMCLRQMFSYNKKYKYNYNLILHTDKGGQFRSSKFQEMLRRAEIKPSHARNCLENGLSERANGIVKNEYLIDYNIKSVDQLNRVLSIIKKQINEVWPSKALGYKTPKEYAQTMRQLKASARPIKMINEVKIKQRVF